MIWRGNDNLRWHKRFAWQPVRLGGIAARYPYRYAWLRFVWARACAPGPFVLWEYAVSKERPEDLPEELLRR